MTLEEVLKHFDISGYELAKRLGLHRQHAYVWKRKGYIPLKHQLRIQMMSCGQLEVKLEGSK